MTLAGLKSEFSLRVTAVLLSGAVHLAAGLAFFHVREQAAPVRGAVAGEASSIMVVELVRPESISLVPGNPGPELQDDTLEVRSTPSAHAPATQGETARGSETAGARANDVATSGAAGEAGQMADLPSSEVFAYRKRLESHLARFRVYPADARTAGLQGVVTIYFTMTRDGAVLDAWVENSSGVSDLDTEALAAIMRAQPLPAPPHSWPGRMDVSLPVTFRLG